MKKMMKKIWACLLACTMIVTMLPGLMVNVKAATSYELWIGNTEVTDENLSGDGWSYDPSTKTLTLDGLNCQESKIGEGVIHSYRDLNLVLKNENKITNSTSALSGNWQSGIRVNGKLTISGSGSLITTGGTGYTSHGITVNNLIINSGTITAIGQEANGSSGIYARNGVTINGGKLIAKASTSSGGSSRGIECSGTFTLNGGNVTASADGATENSYGLEAGSTAEFKYGTIHLKGITAAYKTKGTSSSSISYDFSKKKTVTDSDFTFTAPNDLIYDGKEKAATVTGKDGITCGNITVKYYNENGQLMTETPKAVGTYTVKVDISGNDEYNEIANVTNTKWTFTISYGTATKDMYSTAGINANGWAKGAVTVRAASDYTIGKTSDQFEESIEFSINETERVFYIKDISTGKVYKGSIDYKLDTKVPVISGIESATKYQDSVRFTVSDADSGLADVKDGETSLGNSGTYELTTDGVHTITAVDVAGNSTTKEVKVCADHKYSNITYEWNENNSKCKASAVCTDCGKKVNETVDAKASITKQQSCTDAEITTYTATFTNEAFATQTKEVQTKAVAKPKADGNKINIKANKLTLNSKFSIKTGKSIKVSWGKVKGADGYDVYLSYCGKDKMTLVRSTKSSSVTISKLDKKKINQKNNVRCYVVAYKIVKGKKQEIGKTNLFHAVGRKNKSETEPKNIRLKKTSYVLATGKTAKIKASIVKKNKKLPVIAHTEKIRYATSNAKVATVSKEGKITAKKKGTCYVYVYAINGCAKKVKVTVK